MKQRQYFFLINPQHASTKLVHRCVRMLDFKNCCLVLTWDSLKRKSKINFGQESKISNHFWNGLKRYFCHFVRCVYVKCHSHIQSKYKYKIKILIHFDKALCPQTFSQEFFIYANSLHFKIAYKVLDIILAFSKYVL